MKMGTTHSPSRYDAGCLRHAAVAENATAYDSALRFTATIVARALSQGALRLRSRAGLLRRRKSLQ
jgi:hypothetical protein